VPALPQVSAGTQHHPGPWVPRMMPDHTERSAAGGYDPDAELPGVGVLPGLGAALPEFGMITISLAL
jgi:hypothetical protein